MKDYQRRAKNKYKEKVEFLRVELYPTDADIKKRIAERVEAGEGKATYIKRLICEDIIREETLLHVAKEFGLPREVLRNQ